MTTLNNFLDLERGFFSLQKLYDFHLWRHEREIECIVQVCILSIMHSLKIFLQNHSVTKISKVSGLLTRFYLLCEIFS